MITNAATNADNVVGLVYVAAFAPDEGERLGEIEDDSRDSVLNSTLMPLQYPTGEDQETAVEFAIDPEKLHDAFAADLPEEQTAVMAATQRPVSELAFSEPNGEPAWKKLPSGRWSRLATRRRVRCRSFHGRACRGYDHRGRRLPRDHGLEAAGRRGG